MARNGATDALGRFPPSPNRGSPGQLRNAGFDRARGLADTIAVSKADGGVEVVDEGRIKHFLLQVEDLCAKPAIRRRFLDLSERVIRDTPGPLKPDGSLDCQLEELKGEEYVLVLYAKLLAFHDCYCDLLPSS